MGRYFRIIYLYIVTFATLCMTVAGLVGTVHNIVSYAYPVIDEYDIQDAYYDFDDGKSLDSNLSYVVKMRGLEKIEQRASLKAAFTYLAVFTCGLPLHVFHVKQIKKESEKEV